LATATPSAQFIPTLSHPISSHNCQTFELRPTFVPFHFTPRAGKTIFFSLSGVLTHSEGFPSFSLHPFLPSQFLKLSLLAPSLANPSLGLHNSLTNFGFSGIPKSTMPFNRTDAPAHSLGFSWQAPPPFSAESFRSSETISSSPDSPALTFTATGRLLTSNGSTAAATSLTAGAIAGIVLGCLAIVALAILLGFGLRRSDTADCYSCTETEATVPSSNLESIAFLTYENNVTMDGLAVPTLEFE
jgi:hypothetical protein